MKFAYADPPYLGCCRLYDHYHPDGLCWDDPATHLELIEHLTTAYPDGWALSCHTPSLVTLLPMCPDDVRIGAWVKPFHAYKKGVRPAYAWEPVIYRGGRNTGHKPPEKGGKATTPKDFFIWEDAALADAIATPAVACNITLRKGLTGAKPEAVCLWILDLLNYQPGDSIDDLYPGTAAMGAAAALRNEADLFTDCGAA